MDIVRSARIAGWLLVAILVTGRAHAATCQIANVTPLSFGSYASGQKLPIDSVGELDVQCTTQIPVQVTLGRGLSGHQTPRRMVSRGVALEYNLFLDAAHTIAWGDGTEGTQNFTALAPALQTLRLLIFGRVFALQALPAGSYVDRIVVSVVF